jgi:hypothetical protein
MKRTKKSSFNFSLVGINLEKIEKKYGIDSIISTADEENIPENTTKIDNLEISRKKPDSICFFDESKKVRKCSISMIDFQSNKEIGENTIRYKCFWHRDFIPSNISPIGCPIKYIPHKGIKTYYSEISKETYSIAENITNKVGDRLKNDKNITVDKRGYYLTDGVFCSFNCCLAYIEAPENRTNPIYRHSLSLLYKLYYDINRKENSTSEVENKSTLSFSESSIESIPDIIPAPHWRMLEEFGGNLTIEKFTECFNKIKYIDHGNYFVSLGRLYEDQLKF